MKSNVLKVKVRGLALPILIVYGLGVITGSVVENSLIKLKEKEEKENEK